MGVMVYSLLRVMQDLYHQSYSPLGVNEGVQDLGNY